MNARYQNTLVISITLILTLVLLYRFLYVRELYSSSYKIIKNRSIKSNDSLIDKLMITAHPDDELIFGGRELLHERGWKVVCVTACTLKSNNIFKPFPVNVRAYEFISVMNALNYSYEIWDYEDNLFNANWNKKSIINDLTRVINERPYKKIVTHNLRGEYGHVQHKRISELVHSLNPPNLYVFGYDTSQINPYLTELQELLSHYFTQQYVVDKHWIYIAHQLCRLSIM